MNSLPMAVLVPVAARPATGVGDRVVVFKVVLVLMRVMVRPLPHVDNVMMVPGVVLMVMTSWPATMLVIVRVVLPAVAVLVDQRVMVLVRVYQDVLVDVVVAELGFVLEQAQARRPNCERGENQRGDGS